MNVLKNIMVDIQVRIKGADCKSVGESLRRFKSCSTNCCGCDVKEAAVDTKTKADTALNDAKAYADGLASNYATAAQGTKADSAVQKADVVTGKTNGTIAVQGTDVAVRGLGSAAYTPATDYEKAGAVAKLENGQVTENKNAIAANASEITTAKARIQALEDVKFVAITNEEIDGYFTAASQA